MNILLLCDEYPPGRHGGIGSVIQLLARTFVKMGHKVIVAGFYYIGYGGENRFEDEGVEVYRFRMRLASPFFENYNSLLVRGAIRTLKVTGILEWDIRQSLDRYGAFLQQLIKEHDIDIIEMPDYHDYMRLCNRAVHFPMPEKVPVVVKMNGSMTYFNEEAGRPTPPHIWEMEKAIIEHADALVGVSRYTATKSAKYFDYKREVGILHNAINMPVLPEGIVKKKGLVVFSGSLVQKKGIYQLMKAWNIVAAKRPDAVLEVFGKGPEQKIAALLDEKVRNSVHFNGHTTRENLYSVLATSEVAVFPSYAECFAMAPMEAMACETAVVYSTRTSGPELINHGEDGFLADPDNVEQIAEYILLLLNDTELNRQIAKAGRERVANNFDIQIIAGQNIELYKKVLAERAGDK